MHPRPVEDDNYAGSAHPANKSKPLLEELRQVPIDIINALVKKKAG